ncbi:MAG: archease, partial [Patescibacteria group bacterium]|nr:archease [Patescibacteria group bacterium]
MPYKISEHIADIRMTAQGKNLEQLFTDIFFGIMYVLKPAQKFATEKTEREISLKSLDATDLLADFLNEVLSLASANKESYTHIIFYKIQ